MGEISVGLSLSGGGAKGFAHIGVIKVLEKNNIPIDVVTGTSAGALFGGIYASGTNINYIEDVCLSTGYRQMAKLLDISRGSGGLIKGEKIISFIGKYLSQKRIENFPIRFGCVAADIVSGKKIVFIKGDALKAIKASISIPGFFKPVKYGKGYLLDGGLVDPIPLELTRSLGADLVIGVNVFGNLNTKKFVEGNKKMSLINSLRSSLAIIERTLVNKSFEEIGAIRIDPNVQGTGILGFGSSKLTLKTIKAGERAAKEKIGEIKEVMNNLKTS
jgi:NTE family protein